MHIGKYVCVYGTERDGRSNRSKELLIRIESAAKCIGVQEICKYRGYVRVGDYQAFEWNRVALALA